MNRLVRPTARLFRILVTTLLGLVVVTAPAADAPPPPPPPASSGAASQSAPATKGQELNQAFRAALLAQDFTVARERGQDYLKFLEDAYGPDSPELIAPLANLASAMLELGDGEGALRNTARALSLMEKGGAESPANRVRLLMISGRASARIGDFTGARKSLQRGLDLARASDAVDLMMEAQIYEAMLDVLIAGGVQGDVDKFLNEGDSFARREVEALEAYYGSNSADLAVSLLDAAVWYRFSGQLTRERDLLRRSITLLEKASGPRDPRLSVPLRALAASYVSGHEHGDEAEKTLNQALTLQYDTSSAAAYARADALATLGDVKLVFREPSQATAHYVEAWRALAEHPNLGPEIANRHFSDVHRLFVEPISGIKRMSTGSRLQSLSGEVSVRFTVTELGTAVDFEVTSAPANTDWDDVLKLSAGKIRYRPRLVDGAPVRTLGVPLNWSFRM